MGHIYAQYIFKGWFQAQTQASFCNWVTTATPPPTFRLVKSYTDFCRGQRSVMAPWPTCFRQRQILFFLNRKFIKKKYNVKNNSFILPISDELNTYAICNSRSSRLCCIFHIFSCYVQNLYEPSNLVHYSTFFHTLSR